jgi:Ca2+-binding EF-hand superfamily protein
MLAAFRRLGVDLTVGEAEEMIREADEDGNGEIDVDEFVHMVQEMVYKMQGRAQVDTKHQP